jgi:DNA-binding NarL/FixJ family response regulator
MRQNPIRILIADDTLIAREGWKKVLETADDVEVIAEAVSPSEAVQKALELVPDVLLTDLKWFGDETAGWTCIKNIKASKPEIKIIAVTAYENLIRSARIAGADGALLKTFSREELLSFIRGIVSGEISPGPMLEHLPSKVLSDRELEILALIALR